MESKSETRVQTVCLLIISAVLIACALKWLQPVLIPFVLAMFGAIGLKPIVDIQVRRLRLPRTVAVMSTLLLSLAVLAIIGVLVAFSVQSLIDNMDAYRENVDKLIERGSASIPESLIPDNETLQSDLKAFAGEILPSVAIGATDILSTFALVVIFLCFLLFGSANTQVGTGGTWGEIEYRTRYYILAKTTMSLATGICVGVILWILGVQPAIVFGLMAFLLNFIPNIGSFIATLLPLPVVLLAPDCSLSTVVLVIALPFSVQMVVGNIIEPRVIGQSLRLHEITLLMALIFWGALWGLIGMFLAVPLTAVLRILLEKSELTAPVADLLGGHIHKQ